jgi:lactase-phlorizin hydrolase
MWIFKLLQNQIEIYNNFQTYMTDILKAIHIDKCKVIGYTVWSLIDNFEWKEGYT